jgi:hypothetical protein
MIIRSSWKTSTTNNSANGFNPTSVPKVWKPKSRVRKLRGSDLKWSNPCGDQTSHFVGYTKSPNAQNFCCNSKKTKTTSYARSSICISSINERKTQVRWVIVIGPKAQRWAWANNVLPNGSPYCVPNSNEMIMRSSCQEA